MYFNVKSRPTRIRFFCVLSFLNSAQAKNGEINAGSLQGLPSSWAIQLQPLDNSNANPGLQKMIKTDFNKRGYRVTTKAPHILMFAISYRIENGGQPQRTKHLCFKAKSIAVSRKKPKHGSTYTIAPLGAFSTKVMTNATLHQWLANSSLTLSLKAKAMALLIGRLGRQLV
jgi:hypothetical protein